MPRELRVLEPGLVPYAEAESLQLGLVEQLRKSRGGDEGYLVLLEHPPVVTMGRRGDEKHILVDRQELRRRGIALHESKRGGDVTYHGPGQLVAYPIIRLAQHGRDLHGYLRRLESATIAVLARFGIEADREPDREFLKANGEAVPMTGVWIGDRKIASIGIAITHWITYHGVALNVSTSLHNYDVIHPCGMPDVRMTSMAELLKNVPSVRDVAKVFAQSFSTEFGFRLVFVKGVTG